MAQPSWRPVNYDDLRALPDHLVGEIVDGELHVSPRPRFRHARASIVLDRILAPVFDPGAGGPGGWIILHEIELHLGADVIVPDLAGWRRERMPAIPLDDPWTTLAPDWVCEVLSPSTASLDRGAKLAAYGRERVPHVWHLDPTLRALEVLRLDAGAYRTVVTARGDATVRAEPFDAVALDLAALWAC